METKELKAGDTVEHQVGGMRLLVGPIPFGRLKKGFAVVLEAVGELAKVAEMDTAVFLKAIPDMLVDKFHLLMPVIFDPKTYEGLNREWIEEHMDYPTMEKILKDTIAVNGLHDFFASMRGMMRPQAPAQAVPGPKQTPAPVAGPSTSSPGSTTSSESPMAGPSEKPTN